MIRYVKILLFVGVITTPLFADALPQKPVQVVCIHGILSPKAWLSPASASFKRRGAKVYNWGYKSTKGTIQEHAERLVVDLNVLAKNEPGVAINFFTHSMGALVLRCALNHPDCPQEAKCGRAALVGPPNRGSLFAARIAINPYLRPFLGKKAGQELMTTAQDGFDALGNFPEEMEVLVIAGTLGFNHYLPYPHDGRVAVSETLLPTPHHLVTVKASHPFLPLSYSVIHQARKFLIQTS